MNCLEGKLAKLSFTSQKHKFANQLLDFKHHDKYLQPRFPKHFYHYIKTQNHHYEHRNYGKDLLK